MFKFIKISLIVLLNVSLLLISARFLTNSLEPNKNSTNISSNEYSKNEKTSTEKVNVTYAGDENNKNISKTKEKDYNKADDVLNEKSLKDVDNDPLKDNDEYISDLHIGSYVLFGRYLQEDILWKIIAIENGKPLLFSNKILTLKAFSSSGDEENPNSARVDSRRSSRGSNFWEESTLRHWLNSSKGEEDVFTDYPYNPPSAEYLRLGHNPYENQAGFLSEFTSDEKLLIKPRTHKVLLTDLDLHEDVNYKGEQAHYYNWGQPNEALQNYDNAYYHKVTDTVFLLSLKELKEYVLDNNINHRLKPTVTAVETSTFNSENLNHETYWVYWLRTPSALVSRRVREVDADGYVKNFYPFFSDRGVAPALSLVNGITKKSGEGTKDDPFILIK